MTDALQSDIIIVGAGVAGLSAAVALSGAGARVSVLERKPYIGGRAYSYLHPALDEVIDSQHVVLGCCTQLVDLYHRSGADQHLRWYDRITFLEPATNNRATRRSDIGPTALPAPGHSALSFLYAPMLSLADKTRIALGLREFLRGYPGDDHEAFSTWLVRTKQTERAIRHFWEPVIVGALNDSFDRCSTRYAGQVFHESFLKSAAGGRLGIPTQPLSEFYTAVAQLAERQGTALHLRSSVERIEMLPAGGWQVSTSDRLQHQAEKLLLALPFDQTARLLKHLPQDHPARASIEPTLEHFICAPITTIHLWFDRVITELDHAALLDTRIQWVFNKSRIRRDEPNAGQGQYLELVISASYTELHQTREQILSAAIAELARFFPAVNQARILKSGVLKEARATFSVIPGMDRYRPTQDDLGGGLHLVGDWTRTGWPSTMEGAARSGRLAAQAIMPGAVFLSPDLPAGGLMRWML